MTAHPGGSYIVWARRSGERAAVARCACSTSYDGEGEGIRIARAGGDEGAVSVWVADENARVTWAAGEKHAELAAAGVEMDKWGAVLSAA